MSLKRTSRLAINYLGLRPSRPTLLVVRIGLIRAPTFYVSARNKSQFGFAALNARIIALGESARTNFTHSLYSDLLNSAVLTEPTDIN